MEHSYARLPPPSPCYNIKVSIAYIDPEVQQTEKQQALPTTQTQKIASNKGSSAMHGFKLVVQVRVWEQVPARQ